MRILLTLCHYQLATLRWAQRWRGKKFFDDYYRFIFEAARFEKRLTFFNRGYAHLADGYLYEDVAEKYQVELYRQVAFEAGESRRRGSNVLAIASALGGGLAFIEKTYRPRLCVGVEKSRAAVAIAWKRFDLLVMEGDARDLRLPDGSFDIAINIESSSAFFVPGGNSTGSEIRRPPCLRRPSQDRSRANPAPSAVTFHTRGLQSVRDISANVARSDRLDDRRREQLLARVPNPLRSVLRPM